MMRRQASVLLLVSMVSATVLPVFARAPGEREPSCAATSIVLPAGGPVSQRHRPCRRWNAVRRSGHQRAHPAQASRGRVGNLLRRQPGDLRCHRAAAGRAAWPALGQFAGLPTRWPAPAAWGVRPGSRDRCRAPISDPARRRDGQRSRGGAGRNGLPERNPGWQPDAAAARGTGVPGVAARQPPGRPRRPGRGGHRPGGRRHPAGRQLR